MATTVVRYEPRGAARALFKSRASEVLMAGPSGTGKSLACLFRMHLACLKYPGIRCLIARKTAVSLTRTTLVTYKQKVAPHALNAGIVTWYGGSPSEPAAFRYSNGSSIMVGGLDRPDRVLSAEFDLVFVDEATEITLTDWETLGTRLRSGVLPWQQQLAACNPVAPQHWLYQRTQTPAMQMLVSRHADNPAYVNLDGSYTRAGQAYIEGILGNLTGARRARFLEGRWASVEGIIHEDFDEAVHVVDDFEVPRGWPRYWAIDFGYRNPFVCQFWAEDPDGRLFLYREWYKTDMLVEDHARKLLSLVTDAQGRWTEPRPQRVICDHDAEDRATLERHLPLATTAATKNVTDGLQATQARFKVQPDGKPRIYLMRGALVRRDPKLDEAKKPCSTLEEIPGYVWETAQDGKPTKEHPVKLDDHGCDAMRYVVAEKDLGRRPRVRSFTY